MSRPLFCQLSPTAYRIAVEKNILRRKCKDLFSGQRFAKHRQADSLPVLVYRHSSLIRRRLGNVNMQLQENKAVNLSIAAPKVNGILIRPGETFSFWRLVGRDSRRNGFLEGLTIANGQPSQGVGGGMCQFTNLIHWMVLHSELTIVEHHHHDGLDLFPDFGRQIPFGTGTSIVYNYLDYRVKNETDNTYQLLVHVDDTHLCGELRALHEQDHTFHISCEDEHFTREGEFVYRNGIVKRETIDRKTGCHIKSEIIRRNYARVMYDTSNLEIREEKE